MFRFRAPIAQHQFDGFAYTVVYLPEGLASRPPLADQPRFRVQAKIEGHALDGAFQPGQGRRYLILSKSFMKRAGLELGPTIEVEFRLDDPDRVALPSALEEALKKDPKAERAWLELSPGKQRGLCYPIRQAKRPTTQQKRVEDLLEQLHRQDDLFSAN